MDRLPDELLHLIAQCLPPPSLHSFVLLNRGIYNLFLPLLYTDVSLTRFPRTFGGAMCPDRIPGFLHTIARRPDLARAVKTLALKTWETQESRCEKVPYDVDLVKKLVREQCQSEEEAEEWDAALAVGNPDAFVALIPPRLLNLQKLGVQFPYGEKFFSKMLKKGSTGEIPLFPKLVEVSVSWYDTENAVDSTSCDPFFHFPSLRRIHGCQVVEYFDRNKDENSDLVGFSGVTEIDLSNSNCERGMMNWIKSCRELKSFRIEHGGATVSYDGFHPGHFRTSLAVHKSSLERLWINCLDCYSIEEEEWICSFADFTALKLIFIRLPNLIQMNAADEALQELGDLLPPSLETLCLVDCGRETSHWLTKHLERLIVSKRLPRLTKLSIDAGYRNSVEFTRIQEVCKEAGVVWFDPYQDEDEDNTGEYLYQEGRWEAIWPESHFCCDN